MPPMYPHSARALRHVADDLGIVALDEGRELPRSRTSASASGSGRAGKRHAQDLAREGVANGRRHRLVHGIARRPVGPGDLPAHEELRDDVALDASSVGFAAFTMHLVGRLLGPGRRSRRGARRGPGRFSWSGLQNSIVFRSGATIRAAPVAFFTASTVVSGAISLRTSPSVDDLDDGHLRDDQVHAATAGQGQRAVLEDLRACRPSRVCSMVTTTRLAPATRSMAPAHPLHHLAGDHPVREVALAVHLQRAEDREVDVAAAHHREGVGAREVRGAGQLGHRLLARVDEVGVLLARLGVRARRPACRSPSGGRSRRPRARSWRRASACRCPRFT